MAKKGTHGYFEDENKETSFDDFKTDMTNIDDEVDKILAEQRKAKQQIDFFSDEPIDNNEDEYVFDNSSSRELKKLHLKLKNHRVVTLLTLVIVAKAEVTEVQVIEVQVAKNPEVLRTKRKSLRKKTEDTVATIVMKITVVTEEITVNQVTEKLKNLLREMTKTKVIPKRKSTQV